jgi:phenylacetate-coenzyme A ligase PaaK-like adenylate-forming protein
MQFVARARAALIAPLLRATDLVGALARRHYPLLLAISSRSSALSEALSPHAALRSARRTRREVPAYQDFLASRGWSGEQGESAEERLHSLPIMDRATYILPYSTEARCVEGTIPLRGASIDESSGASGKPQVWIRGAAEREEVQRRSGMLLHYLYGQECIAINGFALGTWVSGLHASEVLRKNGPVKSTGPDVEKALETFDQFGSSRPYVISGYPPFMKHLVDLAEAQGFDWSRYTVHGIVGGEGMSENLRTYLLRRFRTIYSAYGASDLDVGIATEMPLTVAIRRATAETVRSLARITWTVTVVMFVRSEAPKSAEWQSHLSFWATKSAGGQRRRNCPSYSC